MATTILISLFINLLYALIFYKKLRRSEYIYFVQFLPLAIAAVQAGVQYSQARKQKKAAKNALNYKNPGIEAATNQSRVEANTTRYAGQDQDETNIRQGVADAYSNVTRATRSSSEALNAASRLQGIQQRGYQGVAQQGQVFRQNAAEKYRQMLLRQAGVADDNRQYSEALKGAADQNTYNATNSLLGGVAATQWGMGGGNPYQINAQPSSSNLGNGQMSGWNFNPNRFSSFKWNPNAFSAGGSFR